MCRWLSQSVSVAVVPYEPWLTWTEQNQCARNGATWRGQHHGIYVSQSSRAIRDVTGQSVHLQFKIVDARPAVKDPQYSVSIRVGRKLLFEGEYTAPGVYTAIVTSPPRRQYASLRIEMVNEHGQLYCDELTISFNIYFYRTLKWLIAGPFVLMSGALLMVKGSKTLPLEL